MIRRFLAPAAVAIALVLGGCASPAPSDSALAALQERVMTVSTAAQADPATALTELAALGTAVDEALAAGSISAERATRIHAAIALVVADLTAVAPEPSPAPAEPTTEPTTNDTGGGDTGGEPGNSGNSNKGGKSDKKEKKDNKGKKD